MHRPRIYRVASLSLFLAACGGGQAQPASGASPQATVGPTRGSANVILSEEIAASGTANVLQAIKLLRPSMLRGRSGSTSDQSGSADIVVYQDGVKSGGPNALEAMPTIAVREIRFMNAADATTRFGTGHPMGAILVTTKR